MFHYGFSSTNHTLTKFFKTSFSEKKKVFYDKNKWPFKAFPGLFCLVKRYLRLNNFLKFALFLIQKKV